MMLFRVVLMLLLTSHYVTNASDEGRLFRYYSYFSHPDALSKHEYGPFVINVEQGKVYEGHLLYPAKFCSADDAYICVDSRLFSFAFPKKVEKDNWTVFGKEYSLVRSLDRVSILGEHVNLFQVEREDGELVHQYLFSPERGLVAFGVRANDEASLGWFMWSAERRGFGASGILEN